MSPGAQVDDEYSDKGVVRLSNKDQLLLILKLLGHQTDENLSFLTDLAAADYVKKVIDSKEMPKFDELFPDIDNELLRLLKGFLEFNPHLRLSAKEALQSKIFDSIRCPILEHSSKKRIQ